MQGTAETAAMTVKQTKQFIYGKRILRALRERLARYIITGRIPATWEGKEIRRYLLDTMRDELQFRPLTDYEEKLYQREKKDNNL